MSQHKPNGLRQKLPNRQQIFASRWSKPFAPLFDKPYFWTLNRRQAAVSVAVGMFCGLMPGPTQMLSALIVAYFLRTNLPVAVFSTLYTNPITYMPLYYAAYKIGSLILGVRSCRFSGISKLVGYAFFQRTRYLAAGCGQTIAGRGACFGFDFGCDWLCRRIGQLAVAHPIPLAQTKGSA